MASRLAFRRVVGQSKECTRMLYSHYQQLVAGCNQGRLLHMLQLCSRARPLEAVHEDSVPDPLTQSVYAQG